MQPTLQVRIKAEEDRESERFAALFGRKPPLKNAAVAPWRQCRLDSDREKIFHQAAINAWLDRTPQRRQLWETLLQRHDEETDKKATAPDRTEQHHATEREVLRLLLAASAPRRLPGKLDVKRVKFLDSDLAGIDLSLTGASPKPPPPILAAYLATLHRDGELIDLLPYLPALQKSVQGNALLAMTRLVVEGLEHNDLTIRVELERGMKAAGLAGLLLPAKKLGPPTNDDPMGLAPKRSGPEFE